MGSPIPRISRSKRRLDSAKVASGFSARSWMSSGSRSPQAFRTGTWATFRTSSFQKPSSAGATSNPAAIATAPAIRSG